MDSGFLKNLLESNGQIVPGYSRDQLDFRVSSCSLSFVWPLKYTDMKIATLYYQAHAVMKIENY